MMIFDPVVGILHNLKTNTWHPIFFRSAPMPGPPKEGKPDRHKSVGHHTKGFPTREEAVINRDTDLIPKIVENFAVEAVTVCEKDMEWDGEGLPSTNAFFTKTEDGFCERML